MHGYSRLGRPSTRSGSISPSPSPPSSPRFRQTRSKGGGGGGFRGGGGGGVEVKLQSFVERWVYVVISAVYRRRGVLLFAPLLYISVMLLYMGTMGFDVGIMSKNSGTTSKTAPLGSLYRSPQVFQHLWPFMEAENNRTTDLMMNVWNMKLRQSWRPCILLQNSQAEASTIELIQLVCEKNQICDAVAVAGLLNATLVIPIFHLNSVWRDSSKFGEIFDEEFFIYALRHHVNVVRELPEDVLERFDNNISNIVNLRVKGWSSPTYYLQKVLPKLLELGAVRVAPFSNRLAHAVPSDIQGLRCLSNFGALRFSEPIRTLAAKMVDRMIRNSSSSGGKYISVHLRFEEEEQHEMDIARERSWRGKFRKRGRIIRPGAIRMDGKCPLTPLEVGMMLRGMGFDNNTSVYVAAGKIYKADKYMAPLKQMFPRLETKDTLASPEELAPFVGYSSRLAALDYTICLHSEVFVTTQGGNFPHFIIGHRRYSYEGHSKTIIPDKRKLAQLFDSPRIRWESFQRQLREMLHHSDVKGSEVRKPSGSLYTYPMPDCMCKQAAAKNSTRLRR
ncbi:GDP-fucose protein O-fucosyltransferase [Cynara cardunculus var. scolymus]|uniref:O-fucosyltransferase family protein n=1 Tax=Cynara cardunculus var. scolymus TaxID=59895 RepID=A0A103XXI4_CYNCS|nr:GDP-fucose protein O-fucosyltransferase [Cynara cardunculus var. scolymus]